MIDLKTLKLEVNELKRLARNELDPIQKSKLMIEYHSKAKDFLELISINEKARAGMTARELRDYLKSLPKVPIYETGIRAFDDKLGGFATGLFINLAAESGAGKTTLLLKLLTNIAQSRKSVFFSFEMGKKLLNNKLTKSKLTDDQLDNLIIDFENNDLDDLVREIELYAADGIKFFGIDSKMKIYVKGNEPEHQKISKISSVLARLCATKDIVIFLINQMNEDDIKSKRLALKGSGDQKYDSDLVFFITIDENGNRTLRCTKNRFNDILYEVDITERNITPVEIEFKSENIDFPANMF